MEVRLEGYNGGEVRRVQWRHLRLEGYNGGEVRGVQWR